MPNKRTHYRAVFTSDWHLGFKNARPEHLLAFLLSVDCEYLYLVGDILDIWEMSKRSHWDSACTAVVQRVLEMVATGTKLYILPGNHDEAMRLFTPLYLDDEIRLVEEFIHVTWNGKRYLVIHGDQFDFIIGHMKWIAKIGSTLYGWLITLSSILSLVRVRLGYKNYWSLSSYLKGRAKPITSFFNDFEEAALHYARTKGCDGVICGHIHRVKLRVIDGLLYANCGDWIESMTALVENAAGELEIVHPV